MENDDAMKQLNVLSLFDGMSCGQLAINRIGFHPTNYYASEVDKYAIKVAQHNFPKTIQLGDVRTVKSTDLPKIDLLIGGSPCQGFSFAGKGLNFNDPRSQLFFEFVRIKNELEKTNHDLLFLLENVKMKSEYEVIISKYLGIEPIEINSSLVCAQNRERLYWTNINAKPYNLFGDAIADIPQPKDRGIFLKDILQQQVDEKYYISEKALNRILRKGYDWKPRLNPEKTGSINTKNNSGQLSVDSGTTLITENGIGKSLAIFNDKAPPLRSHDGCGHDNFINITILNNNGNLREIQKGTALDANYFKVMDNHAQRTMIKEVRQLNPNTESGGVQPYQQNRIYDAEGISPALLNDMSSGTHAVMFNNRIRRLTPTECCRLQTAPDNYFLDAHGKQIVSDSQIYKMLGNGWTVDVISHIFSYMR